MAKRKSQMNPNERMDAIAHGKPVDRVPFVHKGYVFCARNVGFPVADIYENPEKSYEAQQRTFEQYGADGSPFYTFSAYGSWEFGGQVKWPENRMSAGPSVAQRPIQQLDDVWKLKVPDPREAGCVPRMMEFAQMQEKNGVPIAFICGSPFSHAANLVGVSTFLSWLIDAPEAVHHTLRLMTDHILSVAEYFIETFGKGNVIARGVAATESNALISPRQFKEFSLPYMKELYSKVLEMGAQSIYVHVCGNHNKNLPFWGEVPLGTKEFPGTVSIGHEVDLLEAEKAFPGVIIAGNIEPRIISQGTPDEIMTACRENLEKGKQIKSGFIFMGGCEIPPDTPPYNMYLMQKAVAEYGWYD